MKSILITTLATFLFAVFIVVGAYWAEHIIFNTSLQMDQYGISLGTWDYFPPDEPYQDPTPPGQPLPSMPGGAKPYVRGGTYNVGDVIYYNGRLYVYTSNTNTWGTPDDAWASFGVLLEHIPAHETYPANSMLIYTYNGNSYVFRSQSTSYLSDFNALVTTSAWHPYYKIVYDYIPGGNYNGFYQFPSPYDNGIVKHNGNYYRYNWANQVPGSGGGWTLLNIAYNPNTTYSVGQIATQGGNIYRVVNASRANQYSPNSHQKDAWNLIYGDTYRSFNTYVAGDFVKHNGVYFKAVSGGTFNTHFPGEQINAWNRVDTYYFKSTNTYKTGDIVLYDNILYKATQNITTLKIPGQSTAWTPL